MTKADKSMVNALVNSFKAIIRLSADKETALKEIENIQKDFDENEKGQRPNR